MKLLTLFFLLLSVGALHMAISQSKLTRQALQELSRLRAAVRAHRDVRGDDRCWQDDDALYSALPEGYQPPKREVAVELANCQKYILCRRNPQTEYVSPQRRIEELEGALRYIADGHDETRQHMVSSAAPMLLAVEHWDESAEVARKALGA